MRRTDPFTRMRKSVLKMLLSLLKYCQDRGIEDASHGCSVSEDMPDGSTLRLQLSQAMPITWGEGGEFCVPALPGTQNSPPLPHVMSYHIKQNIRNESSAVKKWKEHGHKCHKTPHYCPQAGCISIWLNGNSMRHRRRKCFYIMIRLIYINFPSSGAWR